MLTVQEASERIRAALPAPAIEAIALDEADGRVLMSAKVARRALPPWDNSAMDGFAVRAAELPGAMPVAGVIAAGDPPERILQAGTTLRIMTGAPVPEGADAVVMREIVTVAPSAEGETGELATFSEAAKLGQHIRSRGEDVTVGQPLLASGTLLGPGEIGLLAAQGFATVDVGQRPRVFILSTGDELVDVTQEPAPGQIVNSNAYALAAQVRRAGGVVVGTRIAGDTKTELVSAISAAIDAADVVVSSGGVSVGDFDFVKDAMAECGVSMDFWKVAMKPGKPLAFGTSADGTPVFGLPGNPVSSMVSFELFARPSILAMQGATTLNRPRARVIMATDYRKQTGRAHFIRAALERRDGELVATPNSKQGSGMLSSMVGIDALVALPADAGSVAAGDSVDALLLRAV